MPNWRKTLLTVGISTCLLGGALIATGTATGGINHLLQANYTKYSKKSEDFSDISALDIDLGNRNLVIEESEDDKAHLTYYQGKEASERIVTSANQGTLKIQQPRPLLTFGWSSGIRSILNFFDNEGGRSTVTLSPPKGTKLSTLKGNSSLGDVSLSGLSVQKLDLSLSAGSLTVKNSTISTGDLSNSLGDVSLSDLAIQKLDLRLSSGSVTIDNTTVEKGYLANSLGDINLNKSKLSDSTIKLSSGSINSQQLTLSGDINIDNSLGDIQLNLVKESLDTLSFDLETSLGTVKVPSNFQSITGESDEVGSKLKRILDNSKGKVFVRDSAGSIELSVAE
ncbi:DUF4097 family beta strand repeat-containing protein [Streptococcus gordonii]|uniref:DUF4097 family beta strand repeat-containing protein n=1 Tax=Streptococcus gordonii TaxID=1302 RepID=UPI001CBE53A3|nr:DUF4097 family beta strand repeat-containing protein [Streptococcus gordonii]MBZ2132516.1 DUF4097 domain-containing protein [Streptococcus gordonii]MBZ2140923.1 DUF4097 domain-containing protein [Streptococcus gordonii]MBZ2143955.1 DUF4097 domain-containing protein [Streptococcus gordonii]MBZ2145674.1 DUF4097 domain-containing protein [Streptococcus gordonii]